MKTKIIDTVLNEIDFHNHDISISHLIQSLRQERETTRHLEFFAFERCESIFSSSLFFLSFVVVVF